jgi:hypothetical protein
MMFFFFFSLCFQGRDIGLRSYNDIRSAYSLPRRTSFQQLGPAGPRFQSAYSSVDQIDAFAGALTENQVPGGSVGELNARINCEQFARLRNSDPFWYERPGQFPPATVTQLRATRLRDIILRNEPSIRPNELAGNLFNANQIIGGDGGNGGAGVPTRPPPPAVPTRPPPPAVPTRPPPPAVPTRPPAPPQQTPPPQRQPPPPQQQPPAPRRP